MNHSKKPYYKEIVRQDCYRIFSIARDTIDYVIDIGANVGVFSQACLFTQRKAQIFAFEPAKETFEILENHVLGYPFIQCYNLALGCGKDLYFKGTNNNVSHSGSVIFTEQKNNNYKIASKTLPDIFKLCDINIDKTILLKIDCEGCERYLLNDKETISLIKACKHVAMEIHFPSIDSDETKRHFPEFLNNPSWATYQEWLEENFASSHNTKYTFLKTSTRFATVVIKKNE